MGVLRKSGGRQEADRMEGVEEEREGGEGGGEEARWRGVGAERRGVEEVRK